MKAPFVSIETIRRYAAETLSQYEQKVGAIEFPIDLEDLFLRLFKTTLYDDSGALDRLYGPGVIGCLFPDGHRSPWGRDRLIVINACPAYGRFSPSHTIAHEGGGHYLLHFLKGVGWSGPAKPMYCHEVGTGKRKKDPLEWQADRFAGELVMPAGRVRWLLDGKGPGEVINVELYRENFRQYFDTSHAQMEKRLVDLGYRLIGTKYQWASYLQAGASRSKD
jgi:hypothetical protein